MLNKTDYIKKHGEDAWKAYLEKKRILTGLEDGTIDFVIGTHRLLSNDVKPKNLGLLVIDEEQRFGVTHKEKIKEYKSNVDVLTLTATPIPRTLPFSLGSRWFVYRRFIIP